MHENAERVALRGVAGNLHFFAALDDKLVIWLDAVRPHFHSNNSHGVHLAS